MVKIVEGFPCRECGRAESRIVVLEREKGRARVVQRDFSKTRRHWVEDLCISSDFTGEIGLVDVSNSGKHRCVKITFKEGKEFSREIPPSPYWDYCPVCRAKQLNIS